jgi:hypothetical protein
MREEGVRHPTTSVRRRLPPSMCFCVFDQSSKNVGLIIKYKYPDIVGLHQLVMHAFDAVGFVIICSPFEYLVSFRVLGEAMVGCT